MSHHGEEQGVVTCHPAQGSAGLGVWCVGGPHVAADWYAAWRLLETVGLSRGTPLSSNPNALISTHKDTILPNYVALRPGATTPCSVDGETCCARSTARPSRTPQSPENTLQNAIDRFYEAITTMNMIPGAINLSSYEETFGSIKVGDIIDATKNNSGIIYKVRPRTDGIYIPSISASTNTEAADNPRVNISVSSDLEILKEQTVDPDNSVLVEKGANGWNTFKTYKFPETAPLSANQEPQ